MGEDTLNQNPVPSEGSEALVESGTTTNPEVVPETPASEAPVEPAVE